MRTVLSLLTLLLVLCASWACPGPGNPRMPVHVPSSIDLLDQYEVRHQLSFPSTNITVFTIADRTGSEQVDGWIAAFKGRYAGRIDLRGIADVGGAPGFLRGRIRKKFRELRQYPVMMDWSGQICAQLSYGKNVANILVVGFDGAILGRFSGAADASNIAAACAVLDKALAIPPGAASLTLPAESN